MKIIKIVAGLVVVLVVILAVVIGYSLKNLDSIIKQVVESEGSKLTKTSVTLASVNMELIEGKGSIGDFVIANPPGFSSPYAIKMGAVRLQVDPASVTSEVKVIKEIYVDGVELVAEQVKLDTNIKKLLDNMSAGAGKSATEETEEASEGSDIRLRVEKFTFSNSSVKLITEKWGEKTLKIPPINLSNLGKPRVGLTPEELGRAVLSPVLKQAKDRVKDELQDLAKDELEDKAKEKLKEKLGADKLEKLDKLKNLLGR